MFTVFGLKQALPLTVSEKTVKFVESPFEIHREDSHILGECC